jgi:hypothetical protein
MNEIQKNPDVIFQKGRCIPHVVALSGNHPGGDKGNINAPYESSSSLELP